MKWLSLLFVVFIFLSCSKEAKLEEINQEHRKQYWKKLPDFPIEQQIKPVSFVLNNEIYIGLGDLPGKSFWKFNTQTENWIRIADFPGYSRYGALSFSLDNKGYVGLGYYEYSCGYGPYWNNDIYFYDPMDNKWTKIDPYYDGIDRGTTFVLNNKVFHIGGGKFSVTQLKTINLDIKELDFNTLSPPDLKGMRSPSHSYVFDGAAYIITDGESNEFNQVYRYDPISKVIEFKSNLPDMVLWQGCALVLNSYGYFGGGYLRNGYSRENKNHKFYKFDHRNNSWEYAFDYPGEATENLIAAGVNGKLYMGIGKLTTNNGGKNSTEFWCYDPKGF